MIHAEVVPLLGLSAERVARPDGSLEPGVVWVDRATATIVDVVRADSGPAGTRPEDLPGRLVELGDCVVAPGFVDLHVHGGDGRQVNGESATSAAADVAAVAAFHAAHGTTSLLATTVSDSPARLRATVAGVAALAARPPPPGGARVLGAHLEGPFISPQRAGAQDPGWIRPPDRAELRGLLETGAGTVRMVTLAPERPGAASIVSDCLDAGVRVAVGHTDARYDEVRAAFDAGASHVTHLFDAMRPFHHRDPGPVAAALLDPSVTVELICDLHHLDPLAVELVMQAAGGRAVLVTDATAPAGSASGRHRLGGRDVDLVGTKVVLASDHSVLAGSTLTMDRAVRHAVERSHVTLADALAAASAVPVGAARLASLRGLGGLGTLAPGAPADLVVLDAALDVVATLVAGAVAHDPSHRLG